MSKFIYAMESRTCVPIFINLDHVVSIQVDNEGRPHLSTVDGHTYKILDTFFGLARLFKESSRESILDLEGSFDDPDFGYTGRLLGDFIPHSGKTIERNTRIEESNSLVRFGKRAGFSLAKNPSNNKKEFDKLNAEYIK